MKKCLNKGKNNPTVFLIYRRGYCWISEICRAVKAFHIHRILFEIWKNQPFCALYLSSPHHFGISSFKVTVSRVSKSSIISVLRFSGESCIRNSLQAPHCIPHPPPYGGLSRKAISLFITVSPLFTYILIAATLSAHEELYAALDTISNREREYLLYRFGFEDNMDIPWRRQRNLSSCQRAERNPQRSRHWTTYGWNCRGGFIDDENGHCGGFLYTRLSKGKSCANRDASRPYWKSSVKWIFPLKFLIPFLCAYTNCKNAACNASSENAL